MKRPVVHFEIGCDNLPNTARFYQEVFNWKIQVMGVSAAIDTQSAKGIPGHLTKLGHEPKKYINIYVETDDVERDLEVIHANGGKKQVGPIKLPDGRTFAWFEDVAGNTVGLITPLVEKKKAELLVRDWFHKWETGDFLNLPVSEHFKHTSPFGTIEGKENYLDLVRKNEDKFLGYTFNINDEMYEDSKACISYQAVQGDFSLDVSEWHYIEDNVIKEVIAFYHIGEIREDRQLDE